MEEPRYEFTSFSTLMNQIELKFHSIVIYGSDCLKDYLQSKGYSIIKNAALFISSCHRDFSRKKVLFLKKFNPYIDYNVLALSSIAFEMTMEPKIILHKNRYYLFDDGIYREVGVNGVTLEELIKHEVGNHKGKEYSFKVNDLDNYVNLKGKSWNLQM